MGTDLFVIFQGPVMYVVARRSLDLWAQFYVVPSE